MTRRIQRKPRKQKTLLEALTDDTITARMLRRLHGAIEMPQADFMREYHVLCAREHPSRSSFNNNFGRFVGSETFYADGVDRAWTSRGLACMHRKRETVNGRVTLEWVAPLFVEMVASLDDDALQALYERLESRCVTKDGDTDDELAPWVQTARDEITMRIERNARALGARVIALCDAASQSSPLPHT